MDEYPQFKSLVSHTRLIVNQLTEPIICYLTCPVSDLF